MEQLELKQLVMKELENKIREALPRLKKIEKGQKFLSKYYGTITATKIDDIGGGRYDIYGFDEVEGLPRCGYYPKEFELIGHRIKLNNVLEYVKIKDLPIYNTIGVNTLAFGIFPEIQYWDLSSVYLDDQSDKLKEFLNNL